MKVSKKKLNVFSFKYYYYSSILWVEIDLEQLDNRNAISEIVFFF